VPALIWQYIATDDLTGTVNACGQRLGRAGKINGDVVEGVRQN
jgi:hypothetical protein